MEVENWVHIAEGVVAAASVAAVFIFGWWVKIKAEQRNDEREDYRFKQEQIEAERKRIKEDTEEARRQKKEDDENEDKKANAIIEEYRQLQALMRKDKEADRKMLHEVRDQCHTLASKVMALEAQHDACLQEKEALKRQAAMFKEALRRAGLWPWPTDRPEAVDTPTPEADK